MMPATIEYLCETVLAPLRACILIPNFSSGLTSVMFGPFRLTRRAGRYPHALLGLADELRGIYAELRVDRQVAGQPRGLFPGLVLLVLLIGACGV